MKTTPINRRPIARDRGTILILVVVLLVLLALIGTAYLSSTAIERYSTAQQADLTEAELMLDGAVALSKKLIADGVFDGGQYRPATDNYRFTMAGTDQNAYLAERTPNDEGGIINWHAVSMPALSAGSYTFETPDGYRFVFGPGVRTLTSITYQDGANLLGGPHAIVGFEPTSIGGYPAIAFLEKDSTGTLTQRISVTSGSNTTDKFLAADADGDGIADSLMVRISPGPISGVTYYMAMRVIDGGSAINPGTAGSRTTDYPANVGNGADPLGRSTSSPHNLGMFLSHVGLWNILPNQPEMANLYTYRNGGSANANLDAYDDTGTMRTDFGYATQGQAWEFQLARRLRNPGYYNGSTKYRAFGSDVAAALAYHGVMAHPELNRTTLDIALPDSARAWNNNAPRTAFAASDVTSWFNYYYNFTLGVASVRGLLAAYNPVTNQMPVNPIPGLGTYVSPNPQMVPYVAAITTPFYAPRVNVNTASFGELWWGFYQVMADAGVNPTAVATGNFRSPTRDPAEVADRKLKGLDVALIRSAIAAASAIDYRDSDYNVSSFAIRLVDQANPANATYEAIVYGYEPAPFITEVFVDTNRRALPGGKTNPRGYVAIELHNPYDFDIELSGYNLGIVDRRTTGGTPAPKYSSGTPNWLHFLNDADGITGFNGFATDGSAPVVPAHGYLVLDNFKAEPGAGEEMAATQRPFTNGITGTNFTYVRNLHKVIRNEQGGEECPGGELYLLRPRTAGVDTTTRRMRCPGLITGTMEPAGVAFNEANREDLIPVDSIDFVNVTQMATNPPEPLPAEGEGVFVWHGIRQNDTTADGPKWKFVFPGPYELAAPANSCREQYVKTYTYNTGGTELPNADTTFIPKMNLGGTDPQKGRQENDYPPVQMQPTASDLTTQSAGPNKPGVNSSKNNHFPFGGFMRDGDILQVPFAGAYIVRKVNVSFNITPAGADAPTERQFFLECNSLPKDLVYARFSEPNDVADARHQAEQLGRFCPIRYPIEFDAAATVDDINNIGPRLRWAVDLFDYLTVNSPATDTLPDISPYTSAGGVAVTPNPVGVANADSSRTNAGLENFVGLEGKININTASWKVLSALPLAYNPDNNEAVAKAIVRWREEHGAFKTVMELNAVWNQDSDHPRSFRSGWRLPFDPGDPNNLDRESADPANDAGDFAPFNGGGTDNGDGVTRDPPSGTNDYYNWDFERQFLQITRLSNLLTVRSDTFNSYVQVQGWRNVGTGNPVELVVQRRAAYIGDRTATTPTNRKLNVIGVPAN